MGKENRVEPRKSFFSELDDQLENFSLDCNRKWVKREIKVRYNTK
jgi:hypothetical protein